MGAVTPPTGALRFLAAHLYAGVAGNFRENSERARRATGLEARTGSVWSGLAV